MISAKKRQVIESLVQEILAQFPRIELDGVWDKGDGSVGIRLWCSGSDAWKVSETFAWKKIEILEKHGYDIFLMPFDRAANGRSPRRRTRLPTGVGTVKAAVA